MFEIVWQEFNRRCKIVTKRKKFHTEEAMEKYNVKIHNKENFWQIITYRKGA